MLREPLLFLILYPLSILLIFIYPITLFRDWASNGSFFWVNYVEMYPSTSLLRGLEATIFRICGLFSNADCGFSRRIARNEEYTKEGFGGTRLLSKHWESPTGNNPRHLAFSSPTMRCPWIDVIYSETTTKSEETKHQLEMVIQINQCKTCIYLDRPTGLFRGPLIELRSSFPPIETKFNSSLPLISRKRSWEEKRQEHQYLQL